MGFFLLLYLWNLIRLRRLFWESLHIYHAFCGLYGVWWHFGKSEMSVVSRGASHLQIGIIKKKCSVHGFISSHLQFFFNYYFFSYVARVHLLLLSHDSEKGKNVYMILVKGVVYIIIKGAEWNKWGCCQLGITYIHFTFRIPGWLVYVPNLPEPTNLLRGWTTIRKSWDNNKSWTNQWW